MQPERMTSIGGTNDKPGSAGPDRVEPDPTARAAAVDALVAGFAAVVELAPADRLQRVEFTLGDVSLAVDLASSDPIGTVPVAAALGVAAATGAAALGAAPVADRPAPSTPDDSAVTVGAPIVGVFYSAPRPGAAPFCAPGTAIEKGQQLGIVEAMKMMNEIVAPCAGTVVSVEADSGAVVEFGQALFVLEPSC